MAEGTYEYECLRAELLGLDKPDYEEFMKTQKASETEICQDEENLKVVESDTEELKGVSGKLDELNSILSSTQKKISRFRASCGSLTNLLKFKIGHGSSNSINSATSESCSNSDQIGENEQVVQSEQVQGDVGANHRLVNHNGVAQKNDLSKALDNNVDKLDSLIFKAENAQYSMSHQNKQMNSFLK